jgi:predicted transcriptional regulator
MASNCATQKGLCALLVEFASEKKFNVSAAARALNVDRKTVRYHLEKLKEGK